MTTDAADMETKLMSTITTTEIRIGKDLFNMDVYKDYEDEALNNICIMEKKPDMWVEVVDETLKDWLISAVEAHEREGSPF